MLEILEMPHDQIDDVLTNVGYGHFACSSDDQPYVLPINYAYKKPHVYIYTTAGLKSEIIERNPLVCLQVEEFLPDGNWRSVVVTGKATLLKDPAEREKAVGIIRSSNPTLMPALALKWRDNWIRENIEVVYRIDDVSLTGLRSGSVQMAAAAARPAAAAAPKEK